MGMPRLDMYIRISGLINELGEGLGTNAGMELIRTIVELDITERSAVFDTLCEQLSPAAASRIWLAAFSAADAAPT